MAGTHPYKSLPSYAFWRRSFEGVPPGEVDVVAKFPFAIGREDKIATAGSCFAQHIARRLSASGFNYFVAEPAHPILGEEIGRQFNYGVFSCRYGNIYTSRQLLQLFKRAYGEFAPIDDVWEEGGRYIDPCRPVIQPNGFATLEEMKGDRERHLAAVRQMFEELDVFVFTMGLTEGFINRADGTAYPVCPGVSGGQFDDDKHVFHNETVAEVVANTSEFLARLRAVRPHSRVILTVSPVPLVATKEDRHVLQSTTYSKSVLRVAAQELVGRHSAVAYFPSYEVITGNYNRGAYYQEDLREVREEGVEHVMRLFFKHATKEGAALPSEAAGERGKRRRKRRRDGSPMAQMARATALVCEEEMLDA
jgi:hypothetical protein